jgi:hypothetical protein
LVNDQINRVYQQEGKNPKVGLFHSMPLSADMSYIQSGAELKFQAIILVGGFGACNYLYEMLVSENKGRKIEILQPTAGEGA